MNEKSLLSQVSTSFFHSSSSFWLSGLKAGWSSYILVTAPLGAPLYFFSVCPVINFLCGDCWLAYNVISRKYKDISVLQFLSTNINDFRHTGLNSTWILSFCWRDFFILALNEFICFFHFIICCLYLVGQVHRENIYQSTASYQMCNNVCNMSMITPCAHPSLAWSDYFRSRLRFDVFRIFFSTRQAFVSQDSIP